MGPDGPSPKPSQEILEDNDALQEFIEKWKESFRPVGKTDNTKHFEIG